MRVGIITVLGVMNERGKNVADNPDFRAGRWARTVEAAIYFASMSPAST